MPAPAIRQNDHITGLCSTHQIPNPSSGAPQPGPPMPFDAPLLDGLAPTVTIGGLPAAVMGSSGLNMSPHVGLHAADPFMMPMTQEGRITSGSATVFFGGQPAANATSSATLCVQPGSLVPSVSNVLIG